MSDLPQAQQVLVIDAAGAEAIRRSASCLIHNRQSSNYLGVTEEGWQFRCREGHLFTAAPDPKAPKSKEEIEKWLMRQRQQRLKALN